MGRSAECFEDGWVSISAAGGFVGKGWDAVRSL